MAGAELVRNLMTFDVEDWHQSTVDFDLPITRRVVDNTLRVLEMLESRRILGTFFVLGLVAEAEPDLVRRIHAGGHEIATHGHSHRPVHAMRPGDFRADLRRSLGSIQDITGERIAGYRAPDFSIRRDALWALEILSEEGLRYDSSIFPFAGPRYGISEAFTEPCRVICSSGASLVEFPLPTVSWLGLRLPACGGGYFRLLPYALSRAAARRLNARGIPATAYFHPYELDAGEISSSPHRLPLRLRLSQGAGRSRVAGRLGRFLDEFRWEPVRAALDRGDDLTGDRVLDLRDSHPSGSPWRHEARA